MTQIERRGFLKGLAASATASLGGLSHWSCTNGGGRGLAPTAATFPTAMCQAPMRMLYEKEIYKETGPDGFRPTVMSGWDPVREGLLGGKLHYAYGNLESMIQVEKGLPFHLTGGVHTGCIKMASQPEIQGVRDLKGKTIGVNVMGSFTYFLTLYQLHKAGLDPMNDATILAISPPDSVPAFRQGKIDAMTMWDPTAALLDELDIPHRVLFDTTLDEGFSDKICCFGLVPGRLVEERPGLVRQLNEGITVAARWLDESEDHVNECVDIQIEKNYMPRVASVDFQRRLLGSYDFSVAGDQERAYASVRFYAELAHDIGAIETEPREMVDRIWRDYTKLPESPV